MQTYKSLLRLFYFENKRTSNPFLYWQTYKLNEFVLK